MREITIRVYEFDELSDQAQERAVEVIREKLDGVWWDSADNEDVQDAIVYALAGKLGTPGRDAYGAADFPGVDGVSVDGWDVDRHQSLAVSGRLDRDNAPALPWADGLDHVELLGRRSNFTSVDTIECDPADCTCPTDQPAHDEDCPSLVEATDEQHRTLDQAVRDALSEAWSAGEAEAERKTGEQYAREKAADHQFTETGELY